MENGENVIGMLCHMTIGLRYWSHECTPSWASNYEEGCTEVMKKYQRKCWTKQSVSNKIVVMVETKCACFVMESCPADCGSLTMKSMLMVSHGADGMGRGWSSPVGGHWNDLVQRHMPQVETYLPTYLDICGHQ